MYYVEYNIVHMNKLIGDEHVKVNQITSVAKVTDLLWQVYFW